MSVVVEYWFQHVDTIKSLIQRFNLHIVNDVKYVVKYIVKAVSGNINSDIDIDTNTVNDMIDELIIQSNLWILYCREFKKNIPPPPYG